MILKGACGYLGLVRVVFYAVRDCLSALLSQIGANLFAHLHAVFKNVALQT